jgi:hypothetical protein
VSAEVKSKILFEAVNVRKIVCVSGLSEFVECGVGTGHVGGVVLAVMQLHDGRTDVRCEGRVVVIELGQDVNGHSLLLE